MIRASLSGWLVSAGALLTACATPSLSPEPPQETPAWSIAIHGGAGVILAENMDDETEAAYRDALSRALDTGQSLLEDGASGLDVVEEVIRQLEDDPKFNAGRGAVLTAEGGVSLDASIMRGDTLEAGAVAGLSATRHPISAAREAMENSPHVLLAGEGADTFSVQQDLEQVSPDFFITERRWQSLLRVLEQRGMPAPPRPAGLIPLATSDLLDETKFGTVGVVVLDGGGVLVAGTSTGGTTAKRWGRVGDSPIIGAGTYAKNGVCAVSATGTGEYFIRLAIAHAICLRAELQGISLQAAADHVIHQELTALGGDGGVVFVDENGVPGWSFNTPGMYRASATSAGNERRIEIFSAGG